MACNKDTLVCNHPFFDFYVDHPRTDYSLPTPFVTCADLHPQPPPPRAPPPPPSPPPRPPSPPPPLPLPPPPPAPPPPPPSPVSRLDCNALALAHGGWGDSDGSPLVCAESEAGLGGCSGTTLPTLAS